MRCLLSMGREDDVKGFWHMLKIFSLVQKRIPEARLILVGEGSFEEYKKLAENLGIRYEILPIQPAVDALAEQFAGVNLPLSDAVLNHINI